MMTQATEDLFDNLWCVARAVRAVTNMVVPISFANELRDAAVDDGAKLDRWAESTRKLIEAFGLKHPDLGADCRAWLEERERARWKGEGSYAPPLLLRRHEDLKALITALPNDLTKAQELAGAMYRQEPTSLITAYVRANRTRFEKSLRAADPKLVTKMLEEWDCHHAYERYRLLRSVGERASRAELIGLQDEIREEVEQLGRRMAATQDLKYLPTSREQLLYLWLCSRDNGLKAATFAAGRRLSQQISRWQQPNGSWHDYRRAERSPVDAPGLAAIMLCLTSAYGDPEEVRDSIATGVGRLLSQQRSDGAWSWLVDDEAPCWMATTVALDTIKTAGPTDTDAAERATKWLLANQHPLGGWPAFAGLSDASSLVVVLETLETDPVSIHNLDRMLRLSREMLFKSEELYSGGQTVDLQLAVIAAHHACEMFLYGYFLTLEPQETFVASDGRTIGLSVALGTLEQRLRSEDRLSGRLPHRQQVQQLSTARDLITHRGLTVSASDAATHLASARGFIAHHSRDLLGTSLV